MVIYSQPRQHVLYVLSIHTVAQGQADTKKPENKVLVREGWPGRYSNMEYYICMCSTRILCCRVAVLAERELCVELGNATGSGFHWPACFPNRTKFTHFSAQAKPTRSKTCFRHGASFGAPGGRGGGKQFCSRRRRSMTKPLCSIRPLNKCATRNCSTQRLDKPSPRSHVSLNKRLLAW